MPSRIELYEKMCHLSARMADAARTGDWGKLLELECGAAGLRRSLTATWEVDSAPAADSEHKRTLIRRILEDDAEVRRHTEPWMEKLWQWQGDEGCYRQAGLAAKPTNRGLGGGADSGLRP